ncbi:MAG TPA: M20/M25/M40 family metallo-hydrolase [Xanthobacteraceae bacterium]|jgi:acetylornithine deacetylase/succinyl-diaminopimelate desuccinylase-like protein
MSADDVIALIDRDELVRLALDICNIDSAVGHEAEVGEHLHDWMRRQGFLTRKIGLLRDRFNLLGTLPGAGSNGCSLIFNSHMDTAVPREPDLVHADTSDPVHHGAWQEGDLLVGEGICNDKGPMAAFLIAARAILNSGHRLKGDLLLSAVVSETGGEPCDEPPGSFLESKELGARFLITHGGVADYALVAEGTGFGLVWVEAGEFWYRLTLRSGQPPFYTPYLPDRTTLAGSPNMIVAAAAAIEAIEKWAAGYQKRNVYRSAGGTIVPKAQIGGIRSGNAHRPFLAPQVCELYVDVRSVPGQDPLAVKAELGQLISGLGLAGMVELYSFRPAFEARHVEPLAEAVCRAHRATFGAEPPPAPVETSSMWRDINAFNEVGIPALTYGPRSASHAFKRALSIDSLYQAACAYARIALDLCNQEKTDRGARRGAG